MSLTTIYLGLQLQKNSFTYSILDSVKKLQKIQKKVASVDVLKNELETKKTAYKRLTKIIADRNSWFMILNGLQKSLPDNSWITLLKPAQAPNPILKPNTVKTATPSPGSIFNKRSSGQNNAPTNLSTGPIEWIKIRVNTLIPFRNLKTTEAEDFKEKLLLQQCFTNNEKEIIITDYSSPPLGDSCNISSFELIIKLKTPLSQ